MKIAYLSQAYPPMISGAAILVERLAKSMAARGHEVLVIAASDRDYPYRSIHGTLSTLRLRSIHNPLRIRQRFLLYPRIQTLQALKEFRPNIIHTHEAFLISRLGLAYARSMHTPILMTVHQCPWFVAKYLPSISSVRSITESILWMYARWLTRQFTCVITPSQTISDLVTSKTGVQADTISNGIALETFQSPHSTDDIAVRNRLQIPADVPVILHVGRLDRDKNVERVVQAAAQAMQQTNAHLLIVGDGTEKQTLIKMCAALNIADRVHFPGYIAPQDGLPKIYNLASLFVTASEIEVQSLVLLEAIASGLPIVAVRATFVPEVVHNGINGFLAEPGDMNGLASAISSILNSPAQRQEMGKSSRVIAERHDIHVSMDLHEQLYMSLVKQRKIEPVMEKMDGHSRWEPVEELDRYS